MAPAPTCKTMPLTTPTYQIDRPTRAAMRRSRPTSRVSGPSTAPATAQPGPPPPLRRHVAAEPRSEVGENDRPADFVEDLVVVAGVAALLFVGGGRSREEIRARKPWRLRSNWKSCPRRSTTLSKGQRSPCKKPSSAYPVAYPTAITARERLFGANASRACQRTWAGRPRSSSAWPVSRRTRRDVLERTPRRRLAASSRPHGGRENAARSVSLFSRPPAASPG